MRGGGWRGSPPPQKKCHSEGGPPLTFPNVKNDARASTKAQKSQSLPGLFLTLGKVNCHRHLGGGGRLRLTFFWGGGGDQLLGGGGGGSNRMVSMTAKSKIVARFAFNRGEWINLVAASELCDDKAASARRRASRRDQDNLESRSLRAEMLVSLGEMSSARQALEGVELAPRNQATLNALRDPTRRPPRARAPLPDNVMTHTPHSAFELDEHQFSRNLRSATRGAAAGPSGMTTEHFAHCLMTSTQPICFCQGERCHFQS